MLTYPEDHVATGLGDTPVAVRPLVATLWGRPRSGRALARTADGVRVSWKHGHWSVFPEREVAFREVP